MKKLIYILFLFYSVNSFTQNVLFVDFIPNTDSHSHDFHLFKSDTLIYSNCKFNNEHEILDDLKKGEYLITYNTIFGIDSLMIEFKEDKELKFIDLETEKIEESKLTNTFSAIESLENNEKITLKYNLGACFVSDKKEIVLTKYRDQYYKLEKGKRKKIGAKRIQNIIRYEKMLRNLNTEKNINGTFTVSTCSEFISLEKDNEQIFQINIYCGFWSKSSEIKKWLD